MGKCIADLGVRITPEIGFHHEGHDKYVWDSSGGSFPYGHLSHVASAATMSPVTFHHLADGCAAIPLASGRWSIERR